MGQTERRDRLVHRLLGPGTLIWEDDFSMRFEVDGGPVLRFEWAMIGIGTPDYYRRCKRKKDLDCTEEERQWTTVQTTFGEVMAFRRESAPQLAPAPAQAQAELRL